MSQTFSDYQLVKQLARKNSSCVYLARSLKEPSDEVIFKVFNTIRLNEEQEQKNFLQEVHLLKQLHHPYILPLLGGGIEEGYPFLVSKYVPLGSLRSSINSSSPMYTSLNEAVQIIVRVGQALSYAHTWKRLHTNIKPENILFDSDGRAVLADFALHSMMTSNIPIQQPEPHSACYIAPEQQVGHTSRESDQYALGCIAYELLSGHPPFTWQSLEEAPPLLSQLVPDLPEYIEAAIDKALAKDPSERHASITTFIEALTARPLKVTAFPLIDVAVEQPQKTASAAEQNQIQAVALVPQSPLTPAATSSPAMIAEVTMAIPESDVPQRIMLSFADEQTAPLFATPVPVATLVPEESWQAYANDAETANMPKRKATKMAWVALSLAGLFVLLVVFILVNFQPSGNSTQADQQQTTSPTVQEVTATPTIMQEPSPTSGESTTAPTAQPVPITVAQGTHLIPTIQPASDKQAPSTSTPVSTPTTEVIPTPMPTPTPVTQPALIPKGKHIPKLKFH